MLVFFEDDLFASKFGYIYIERERERKRTSFQFFFGTEKGNFSKTRRHERREPLRDAPVS